MGQSVGDTLYVSAAEKPFISPEMYFSRDGFPYRGDNKKIEWKMKSRKSRRLTLNSLNKSYTSLIRRILSVVAGAY